MHYFNEEVDARLVFLITRILAREYFERVENVQLPLLPLTAYQLKGDKVGLPICLPENIESTEEGGFIVNGLLVTNAGVSGSYPFLQRSEPDPDLIASILRLCAYLVLGDTVNTYALITELSEDTKNVINENRYKIRKHQTYNATVVPCQL